MAEGCDAAKLDQVGTLLEVESVLPGLVILKIDAPRLAASALPGQFVLLRAHAPSTDPLLGRPIAIMRIEGDRVFFMIQIVGRGTKLLAELRPGEPVGIRGPLGTPLWDGRAPLESRVWLAGGGAGVAPMLLAHQRALECGCRTIVPVMGIPGKGCEPLVAWFSRFAPDGVVVSDDGTLGVHGNPVSYLEGVVKPDDEIWVCGPDPMVHALVKCLVSKVKRVMTSFEVRMACGFGGCLACSIATRSGKKRVCVDGSFFDAREVIWDAL